MSPDYRTSVARILTSTLNGSSSGPAIQNAVVIADVAAAAAHKVHGPVRDPGGVPSGTRREYGQRRDGMDVVPPHEHLPVMRGTGVPKVHVIGQRRAGDMLQEHGVEL